MASLSRSYRPQTFAELTAQDGIKETLRREVELTQIAHAYLFAGPRGVGKTTLARVFASAMNCLAPQKGEPCGVCDSCKDIRSHSSLDVIEMDAASNTGVDNVREAIVEHVRFSPQRTHKVYILDEAHMLSTSAWNALLKTLEEPPAYAVFILVTTELHKVPATIKSRCQRFDFQKIPDAQIAERLVKISTSEQVTIEDAVTSAIVAKSDGCLRDGETMLGQLIALGEKKITMDLASVVLPFEELGVAVDVLSIWAQHDMEKAMAQIADLEARGISLTRVFDDLLATIRDLLRAGSSAQVRERMKNEDGVAQSIANLVEAFSIAELSEIALVLMDRRRDAKLGLDPRFALELAMVPVVKNLLPHSSTLPPSTMNTTEEREAVRVPPSMQVPQEGSGPVDLATIHRAWFDILRRIDEQSRSISFIMKLVRPLSCAGNILTLEFQYPFHLEKIINDTKTKHLVEQVLRDATHAPELRIAGAIKNGEPGDNTTTAPRDMVSAIMNTFEGKLVEGEA